MVFDQSIFVKLAIGNVSREAFIGLVLTGIMILIFLGSPRATVAVLLAVPLSMLVCLLITHLMGGSINTMILGGLALVFSRLIDNGVIVLENIFRFMEMGMPPQEAAEKGGIGGRHGRAGRHLHHRDRLLSRDLLLRHQQVHLYPARARRGALHLRVLLLRHDRGAALLRQVHSPRPAWAMEHEGDIDAVEGQQAVVFQALSDRSSTATSTGFSTATSSLPSACCSGPALTTAVHSRRNGRHACSACFPSSAAPTFRAPIPASSSSTCACPAARGSKSATNTSPRSKNIIRSVVKPKDLGMIVSNIGVYPDLSAIYTTNASMDTAFVQTSLKEDHSIGSYEYMRRVQDEALARRCRSSPPISRPAAWSTASSTRDCPRPSTFRSNRMTWTAPTTWRAQLAAKIQTIPNVSSVYIPQSINYPGLALNIDRERASLIGLSAKDVVDNVITALTSDGMVAPSYWIDPKSGNNYMVTVQYANRWIDNMSMEDLKNIPLRGVRPAGYAPMQEGRQADPASVAGPRTAITQRAMCRWARWPTFNRSTRPPKWITTRFAA